MLRKLLLVIMCGGPVIGCGTTPDKFADAVDVTGKVTVPSGKSVKDMVLNFQPVGDGHPVPTKLGTDGAFTAKIIPGQYAYYVSAKSGRTPDETARNEEVWLRTIPEKYRSGNKDRVITVEAGKELDLKLE